MRSIENMQFVPKAAADVCVTVVLSWWKRAGRSIQERQVSLSLRFGLHIKSSTLICRLPPSNPEHYLPHIWLV